MRDVPARAPRGRRPAPPLTGPWAYLLWLTGRQRPRIARAAVLGTAWMLTLAVPPYALRMAVDHGLRPGSPSTLARWVVVLVVVSGLTAWLAIMRHRTLTWVRCAGAFTTMRLVSEQAMRLGSSRRRRGGAGEVAALGLSDAWAVGRCLTATGPGVGAVVTYVVVAVLLLRVSGALAAVILVGTPVLVVLLGPALGRLTAVQRPYREQQAELSDQTLDVAGGLAVLNALGGKALFADRFRRRSSHVTALGYRVGAVLSVIEALTVALPTAYLAVVVWLGARLAVTGSITVGELVAVYGYAAVLVVPVTVLVESATDFGQALVPARRLIEFLALEPDRDASALTSNPASTLTSTPEPAPTGPAPLVDTVSGVRVDPGTFVAVATARQSEARLILDRLAGLEPGGRWGGRDPVRMPAAEVRNRLLVADDDAAVFTGAFGDVVAGRAGPAAGDAPSVRVRAAVHTAAADDVVDGLAKGWDERLASGGTDLSGGQRQRVRLARALAADPEVLLAVDPTTALDATTEAVLAGRLREARRGRTTVVSSTSPLVLERADRVHLVIDGQVVASGPHRQLLDVPRYVALVVRGEPEPGPPE